MNAHQRRKARRARTHYTCDNCGKFQRLPYRMLTGCPWCWEASKRYQQRAPLGWMGLRPGEEP